LRNGPFWQDSVIFITYDEHGGYYDHVARRKRVRDMPGRQTEFRPDNAQICPILLLASNRGRRGVRTESFSTTDTSVKDAELLCPAMTANPAGPYPDECATFNQLGFRVPFMAVSPFSKPHYVSHTVGDHTRCWLHREALLEPRR